MDQKGYWHNVPPSGRLKDIPAAESNSELAAARSNDRPRYVTHLEVGEHVEIVKTDGTRIKAQFWEAKGNKVVLRTLPVAL
jgi:hypothetical protein